MRPNLDLELKTTLEIAEKAGNILLSHFKNDYTVSMKSGDEPVTTADENASNFIVASLKHAFPEDGIISEESIEESNFKNCQRVWLIDPMDGTREFINHNDEFSVMIGLIENDQPILGVIYQPSTRYFYWAQKGKGAFFKRGSEEGPLIVSKQSSLDKVSIALSRSHQQSTLKKFCHKNGIQRFVISGSVGLKLALIGLAECDLYITPATYTSSWDTCAPQIILTEAGGQVSDLDGQPLKYDLKQLKNNNGIVATNSVIHSEILQAIKIFIAEEKQSL